MLGDEATIDAVVEALALVGDAPVVVDPVMVAASGAALLDPQREGGADRADPAARRPSRRPNLPEARELAGLGAGAEPGGARARDPGARTGGGRRHRRALR